jgi:phage repressor protein C with HTH and peptisase S24 domain
MIFTMISEPFKDRLHEAMEDETSYSLAKKSGMAESLIRKYLTGESLPGLDKLVLLADFLGVRIEWLAAGRGPKKAGEYPVGDSVGNFLISEKDTFPRDGFVFLPLYEDDRTSMGGEAHGQGQVPNPLAFQSTWLRSELRVAPSNLVLFAVEGDNMEPVLQPGAIVLVDRSAASGDGIFLMKIRGKAFIKRLQYMIDGTVHLLNDNPAYKKESLSSDEQENSDVEVVGRIIWAGKKM